MPKPLMRIPYTGPLPDPLIIPRSANTIPGAINALAEFITAVPSPRLKNSDRDNDLYKTVLLTGAGISVASGLADYRGSNGTYRLNKTYRPIYFHEFTASHEARKRYWARSFLGWTNLHRSQPNATHHAIRRMGELGKISSVITQNVDSFHNQAHPNTRTIELHGTLRDLVCLSCGTTTPRSQFQAQLASLNPAWSAFLDAVLAAGALDTEDPTQQRARGLKTNPDGDVDLPSAPYSTFRYPACGACLATGRARVKVDADGAWLSGSEAGVLKPAVVMFGESIADHVKRAAEEAVAAASRILVVGSSLATYSAWRLVRQAVEMGLPVAMVNLGGVRGEEGFFAEVDKGALNTGALGFRCSESAEVVLPGVVEELLRRGKMDSNWQAGEKVRRKPVAGDSFLGRAV